MILSNLVHLDVQLFRFINDAHIPFLDYFFSAITYLGHEVAIVVLLLIVIYFRIPVKKRRTVLILTASGLLLCGITNQSLKRIIKRDRPLGYYYKQALAQGVTNPQNLDIVTFINEAGYPLHVPGKRLRSGSFPSGHTATAFAAATVLITLFGTKFWCFYVLAALVAYSRVYLGVHFPLDALAGVMIGIGTVWPFMVLCRRKVGCLEGSEAT